MAFRVGAYCTVWEIRPGKGNYTEARINSSKKNKQTGEYEQDFSGFVRFVGGAHNKAQGLKPRDRIKLGDCEVNNRYDKEKKVEYTNFVIYDFEMANGGQTTSAPVQQSNADPSFMYIPDGADEELPFN